MTMIISSSSPKIRKSGIFGPKFKVFCFWIKLCNKANSRALIPDTTMVFQNRCPKHPIKTFLVPNLRFLIFARNFVQSDKLEGVDYQYDNNFSIFQPKDPNSTFYGPKFTIIFFRFGWKFIIWRIQGCWLKIW